MRSGLAWAAVVIVLATGCRGHWPGGSPASAPQASSARTTCTAAHLQLSPGPDLSPATGQNPEAIRLTNSGPRCVLNGYPVVRFGDSDGHRIPFRVADSGDQMVTDRAPARVVLGARGSTWIVLNKYRCDLQSRAAVAEIEVRLPGAGPVGAVSPRSAGWAYCGAGDPGSTVHVSPFEPSLIAGLRQG